MDDEKKKKKNKKKKNKQTKTTVDVTNHCIGELGNENQNLALNQNHRSQVSEAADLHSDEQKTDVDQDQCWANGESLVLAEADKLYWVDRQAHLEMTVKELQIANDVHIQKQASLEEAIVKLQKEMDTHMQNEAGLEETVKRLQKENDIHLQKEASLEMKILQFQSEKDSWLHKEADFEEKINQLTDETAFLSLKGGSIEEKVKQLERERDSWVQKENSMEQTIASLHNDNRRLYTQVMELEESRNSLLRENQQLNENISGLQSQIHNLEKNIASSPKSTGMPVNTSGNEDLNAQLEAAGQLIEKLVVENAELVEKVNELYAELGEHGVKANLSPAAGSELTNGTARTMPVADTTSEFKERTYASGERMDSPIDVLVNEERNDGHDGHDVHVKDTALITDSLSEKSERTSLPGTTVESLEGVAGKADTNVIPNSPDTIDSEEIVQIPLDDNEVGDLGLKTNHDDQTTAVPLTDAPLIGAPFRLISFVAKYVSGADLVNKSSVNSVQKGPIFNPG